MKKFYITTSIAYTNALPHIGFALEVVQADVMARYRRMLNEDVLFLTGTDEHGQKVAKAAEKVNKTPEDFCDGISAKFKKLIKILNLSNNDFIRTTDRKRHWPTVEKVWLEIEKKSDIYKKKYQGLYCSGCEAFLAKRDLIDGKCLIHRREPESIEEENYFFRLSKYAGKIEKLIEENKIEIIPPSRKKEMLSFIGQGLEDVSFSRPRKNLKWGIPVPGDDSQTIYVWSDALVNYLSALDYSGDAAKFKKYWPADVQCVGKDIQKFHCLIWPAMLLSLGLQLPRTIFVHGFITVGGQKMSKSLGNVIDPFNLVEKYGTDAVRYFLLREIPPTEDGDFTYEKFEQRYNSDLAKGLGNFVSRVIALAGKLKLKELKIKDKDLKSVIDKTRKNYEKSLDSFKFNEALTSLWQLISFCDKYIEKEKPWQASEKQEEIVANLLLAVNEVAGLLKPFLPETSEKIFERLARGKNKPLFPRIQ
ncbi:MAG TPA: methionine--tRNA ligase [Patescibacteria group bacterium]|nr:methionine--tRNA ligase [Patescibacteria group bacterium]